MVGEDVESCWDSLKDGLLHATDNSCGWTNGPARHEATWWWNNEVDRANHKKRRLFVEDLGKGGDKEEYLVAKRRARREVDKAKELGQDSLSDVINNADSRGGDMRPSEEE